jgi:hypothetical protein
MATKDVHARFESFSCCTRCVPRSEPKTVRDLPQTKWVVELTALLPDGEALRAALGKTDHDVWRAEDYGPDGLSLWPFDDAKP